MFSFGSPITDQSIAFETCNPAKKNEKVGHYFGYTPHDIPELMRKARVAQKKWALLPVVERMLALNEWLSILDQKVSSIALSITLEQGKPSHEARGETLKSIQEAREMLAIASQPLGSVHASFRIGVTPLSIRRPRGVIVAITPWNFPMLSPMRKIAPALAYGNAILVKPSELAPAAACLVAQAAEGILPEGLLQVLPGDGLFGAGLVASGAEGVTFTGSVVTGRSVYKAAAGSLAEISLELGGKNAAMVHDSNNLEQCLNQIANAAFLCSGQRCTAISRVIVQEKLAPAVIKGLVDRAHNLVPGFGMDSGVNFGPMISEQHLDKVSAMVTGSIAAGARCQTGGQSLLEGSLAEGHFYAPTVLDSMTVDNLAWQEEIFGPVISVMTYQSLDEAFQLLNDTEFGLTSALFSADISVINRFMAESAAGMLHINHGSTPDSNMPFVGVKNSGVGACSVGPGSAAFYTSEHSVYLGES